MLALKLSHRRWRGIKGEGVLFEILDHRALDLPPQVERSFKIYNY
jgi:hypothetical protein